MNSHAVVVIAALDLRRRPDHRSELRSQLLLGELVTVLSLDRRKEWSRVENRADGYRGWVRSWGLRALSPAEAREWERATLWRVARSHLELRSGPGRGATVGPLFWNSPVAGSRKVGGFFRMRLPDGSEGWTEGRNLRRRDRRAGPLLRLIDGFRGVPYLWGGRTPFGFDCSGFVQQTMAGVGVALPRDAHDQFLACRILRPEESPRLGDLIFFGRPGARMTHVGIALGGGLYAHSRGTVRTNSLDEPSAMYDKALAASFRVAGRPRKGQGKPRHSC